MRFVFDEMKAAEAAEYLVRRNGGTMNFGVLLKVLYLADRRSLAETQRSITGDVLVAMKNGTLLSGVYDRIKEDFRHPAWQHLGKEGRDVTVTADGPAQPRLSRFEYRVLEEVFVEYGHRTFSELREITHALPEWDDPGNTSIVIAPEEILRFEGYSEEEIDEIAATVADLNFLSALAS